MRRVFALVLVLVLSPAAADVESPLTDKEIQALLESRAFLVEPQYPVQEGHRTRFLFGAGQASLICAPLRVCLVELEPGESIAQGGVHVGDAVRWHVSAARGGNQITLAVKPVAPDLETTLSIITNRRTYYITLKSTVRNYMAAIAFAYPYEVALDHLAENFAAATEAERRELPADGVDIDALDFRYRIGACKRCRWRPVRVWNDSTRTVIELPEASREGERPALLVLADSNELGLVNYRYAHNGLRIIADGVFAEALLVAGVGRRRQEVSITWEGAE